MKPREGLLLCSVGRSQNSGFRAQPLNRVVGHLCVIADRVEGLASRFAVAVAIGENEARGSYPVRLRVAIHTQTEGMNEIHTRG